MARLCAIADGNNTDASTWALINSTSFNESESSNTVVPTTYATTYTQFTPGAITIDGIGIRLANRTGTTGTFSIELYNHTAGASVAGTEVTIDCSDFVDGITASLDFGWTFFKFSSNVTLIAANAYSVRFKTSTATQISFRGSSTTNPCKFVRTTTTQAPTTGDDRFVMGEWTAAGTTTTRTVTLNDTGAAVDYGSGSNSVVTPALSISAGGIVLAGTTASTTYVQKISGNVVIYNGGILRFGTAGSRMPTTSSFTWTFDCATNVEFGIDVRRKGEFTAYGEDKTRWTLLTADESAAQTVIGVVSTTGWKTADQLSFAPTGTTITQAEIKSISTVDSSTQVTLSAGLTNPHTGSGDVVGEVGNLTSNVKITSTSVSLCTYIYFRESSLGVLDNVELQYIGSNTAAKRGVEIAHINTSINSVTLNSCSFRDLFAGSGSFIGNVSTGTTSNFGYITNNVLIVGNTATAGFSFGKTTTNTPEFTISNNLAIGGGSSATVGYSLGMITGTTGLCENNVAAGFSSGVHLLSSYNIDVGTTISGFMCHSNSFGISGSGTGRKTVVSSTFVRNGTGLAGHWVNGRVNSCNFFGNTNGGILISMTTNVGMKDITFNDCVFRGGDAGFSQTYGFTTGTDFNIPSTTFNNCTFGVTTAHSSADVRLASPQIDKIIFNSCTFSSTTEFDSTCYTNMHDNGIMGIQRMDNTDGDHRAYIRQGIVTSDTTIYRTSSPSVRITPKSATIEATTKLFAFKVPIDSGQTCTISVYVRESVTGDGADYDGNRVKLYVKSNYNLGIASNTLLDTATILSEGDWEQLTGTTATVTDAGVLEFYITCDGTTGHINYDDVTATID